MRLQFTLSIEVAKQPLRCKINVCPPDHFVGMYTNYDENYELFLLVLSLRMALMLWILWLLLFAPPGRDIWSWKGRTCATTVLFRCKRYCFSIFSWATFFFYNLSGCSQFLSFGGLCFCISGLFLCWNCLEFVFLPQWPWLPLLVPTILAAWFLVHRQVVGAAHTIWCCAAAAGVAT